MNPDVPPRRVAEAEQRREFRQLLDGSSVGQPPANVTGEPTIASGMCETCRDDRCDQVDCVMTGCACPCFADKAALNRELLEIYDGDSPESLYDVACALYARGWRRES